MITSTLMPFDGHYSICYLLLIARLAENFFGLLVWTGVPFVLFNLFIFPFLYKLDFLSSYKAANHIRLLQGWILLWAWGARMKGFNYDLIILLYPSGGMGGFPRTVVSGGISVHFPSSNSSSRIVIPAPLRPIDQRGYWRLITVLLWKTLRYILMLRS